MRALTATERDQITPLLPVLEDVARGYAHSWDYAEAYSAGFDGLVVAIRSNTHAETLADYARLSARNAIQNARRKLWTESNRTTQLDCPTLDKSPSPIWELVEELPLYLRETVLAMLAHNGNKNSAAKALGISRVEINDDLRIIRERYGNATSD